MSVQPAAITVPRLTILGVMRRALRLYLMGWPRMIALYVLFMAPALVVEFLLGTQSHGKFLETRLLGFGLFGLPASLQIAVSNFGLGTPLYLYDQFDGLLGALCLPLAAAAVIAVTRDAILGVNTNVIAPLRATLDNWLGYAQLGLLWYICLIVVWVSYNAGADAVYKMTHSNDVFAVIIYALAIALTLLLTIAYRASITEMAIRGTDAVTSSRLGLELAFGPGGLWQPLGLSLAIALLYALLWLLAPLGRFILIKLGVPASSLDTPSALAAFYNVSLLVFNPYAVVCVALYVFEVSARREGFFDAPPATAPPVSAS
ncbi:MAG: hypothetical protein JO219_09755 [Candidatus Eremiobacteraeota bacterium]|nr:hypothetical protein [Candidatus Eremiobacteraeota bacterium]MBV8366361.1 hypothetical protein [Candidatus Eremiobacteraeota bacterium]